MGGGVHMIPNHDFSGKWYRYILQLYLQRLLQYDFRQIFIDFAMAMAMVGEHATCSCWHQRPAPTNWPRLMVGRTRSPVLPLYRCSVWLQAFIQKLLLSSPQSPMWSCATVKWVSPPSPPTLPLPPSLPLDPCQHAQRIVAGI